MVATRGTIVVLLAGCAACAPGTPRAPVASTDAPSASAPKERIAAERIAGAVRWDELQNAGGKDANATRRVAVRAEGYVVHLPVELSPCSRNAGVFITATIEGSSFEDPAAVRLSIWDARTNQLIVRAHDGCHDNFFMATTECVVALNEFWDCSPRNIVVVVDKSTAKPEVAVTLSIGTLDNPR